MRLDKWNLFWKFKKFGWITPGLVLALYAPEHYYSYRFKFHDGRNQVFRFA